ncbi:MAG: hypothetical protein C4522_03760 [Desulfobacteraceae bacterium]|nr:MAG: hypothetical protein C4522_03760 [Desulfobacteraceae bacterium]
MAAPFIHAWNGIGLKRRAFRIRRFGLKIICFNSLPAIVSSRSFLSRILFRFSSLPSRSCFRKRNDPFAESRKAVLLP